jgi:putative ABC transport system permease protein
MPDVPQVRFGQLIRLAARELWHEQALALCSACVLAATLAPLWTLWGLERGVIGTLIQRQESDPVMRQVLPESTASHRFDAAWFDSAARWPEVEFVMPNTRAIANQVDLITESGTSARIDLLPTAKGDPLLAGSEPPSAGHIIVSAPAAGRLKAASGDGVTLLLERDRNGRAERSAFALRVGAVLATSGYDGAAALVPLALLEDIQAWRDGYTVARFGPEGAGAPPAMAVYPLFRMYARSIREVDPLVRRLEREGISVYARLREIESTLGLQRNLRAVLGMVAVIAVSGAVLALVAMQVATLRRKRREYALLKLVGHGRDWLIGLPCVHALAVASAGSLIALVIYALAAGAINAYFAEHLGIGEKAVQLRPADFGWGFAAAVAVSMLPALWGGWRASMVEAADELRET